MSAYVPLMSDQPQAQPSSKQTAAELFYSGALNRTRHFMAALAVILIPAAWWKFGLRTAAGFVFGCLIAYVNFHWLKRAISGFVDRAVGAPTSQSGQGIVVRFLLRYVLMAIGAYVILAVSPASLNGLLTGLFLPVGAIACEAAYEVYAALVRGL